jgi:hypothetical protein
VGPRRLALELAVGPAGTLRPAALLAALFSLPADALATLHVHKVATHFRPAAAPPAALAASA